MTSIAGGMESDFSDSDCDLVYTNAYSEKKSNYPIKYDTKPMSNEVEKAKSANSVSSVNNSESRTKTESFKPRFQKKSRRQCVDVRSSQLFDDLRYAIMVGSLDDTKAILDKGIWVDTILKAGWTGLMYASSSGRHEIVSYLLEKKADPNYHSDLFTPLMAACASSKCEDDLLKCCIILLEKGAHVNVHERHFATPLIFAVREGHLKIVEKLLEYKADVNACDNRSRTPLLWAALYGFGQIVRLLLRKRANAQQVDSMGQTAADLAYSEGHKEIASVLEKCSASPDYILGDKEGESESTLLEPKTSSICGRFPKATISAHSDGNFIKHGELELFLSGLGLQELTSLFYEHKLKFSDLLVMNEEELEKIGIKNFGARNKILEASKAVHKIKWETTSLPSLKQRQYISCPDAVAMAANIAKHLKYIQSTVTFVRQQIQSQPRILELAQDAANVHNLVDEIEDSLKNVRFLNDELRFLKMHLDKVQGNDQFIPADLIIEKVPTTRRKNVKFVLGISIVSIGIGVAFWKYSNLLHSSGVLLLIKSSFSK